MNIVVKILKKSNIPKISQQYSVSNLCFLFTIFHLFKIGKDSQIAYFS